MQYCVYITTYKGSVLPPKYIGSSSVDRVQNGYRGSVRSVRWQLLWEEQLLNYPDLFETEVISTHDTREEALKEELRLQKLYDVVKSTEWVNEAYAQVNGFAGRDVSGELNPMFGRGDKISKWCADNPELASERNRKAANTQWATEDGRRKKIEGMRGKKKVCKTLSTEDFCKLQQLKSIKAAEKRKKRILYNGDVYYGWKDLQERAKISKHLFIKHNMGTIE